MWGRPVKVPRMPAAASNPGPHVDEVHEVRVSARAKSQYGGMTLDEIEEWVRLARDSGIPGHGVPLINDQQLAIHAIKLVLRDREV